MGDEWIDWVGGECPVEPEATVIVRYRADQDGFDFGQYRRFNANAVLWEHYPLAPQTDIIAYKVEP